MKRGELIAALEQAQLAMKDVLTSWENKDLAAAIREMQRVLDEEVNPAIAWWESENE